MWIWLLLFLILPAKLYSQQQDSIISAAKPEFLSGGFIDMFQTGQISASARLLKLYIGEPGKFQLPVSLYSGVTANNLSVSNADKDVANVLINPAAGLMNMMFDGRNKLLGKNGRYTSLHIQYHSGIRLLSLYSQRSGKNSTTFNFIAGAGFTFVTGAWERDQKNNIGLFWVNIRCLFSDIPDAVFPNFFIVPLESRLVGISGGFGIEITHTLNLKVLCFRVLNNQHEETFTKPLLQVSFNYSL